MKQKKKCLVGLLLFAISTIPIGAQNDKVAKIIKAEKINPTTVELVEEGGKRITLDFYGENIFRYFKDSNGGILKDPEAKPEAQILVNNPRKSLTDLSINDNGSTVVVSTKDIEVSFDKATQSMQVKDIKNNKTVLESLGSFNFAKEKSTIHLKTKADEYFYGGGVQNGRFSHKNKIISIENQNSWTDGGVASPNPFYWSTEGYGIMWYTFKKGQYDFGVTINDEVILEHNTLYADIFVMVSETPTGILNDFYQLTGNPILIPKFGLYEGHLNAYNRDFWKEDEKGILYEDGKKYKESQKDNGGIKESLNGEKNNYQFSARAVVDRYANTDMPLGWILPNDGYGAGYGQTSTLDGNIDNLRQFADYAHSKGVEVGLWTQSDLHPKEGVEALLQRDLVKEVRDAGVRVLKTDVAWVGAGYSFGLNGVADAAQIMDYYGNQARPFIISLDGWAGTQRYAGIWSGDQTGGAWEYIRFHIPTYIGSGLSGNSNICSDMDGIFGGKNKEVNIRDFQWKTFTLMQLNMDGWGSNPKYPQALGEPATSINRNYLKLKSELVPYTYSIAKEAVDGQPVMRAMFLDYPNPYTLGVATQYQYMFGPYFLVAPIYQNTSMDDKGNDIRNGIYLPQGYWIDYFTGDVLEGDKVINNFDTPIWKLPIFVKAGAIIPLHNPNNNLTQVDKKLRIYEFYPFGNSSFVEYDDDGLTNKYIKGEGATTKIMSEVGAGEKVNIAINPTVGTFDGFEKDKSTELIVNVSKKPKSVTVTLRDVTAKNKKTKVQLTEAKSLAEFEAKKNVYYYDQKPNLNKFSTEGSESAKVEINKNPQFLIKIASVDTKTTYIDVELSGYTFDYSNQMLTKTGALATVQNAKVEEENSTAYTLTPTWNKIDNADYYEIMFNGMLYSTIKDNSLVFDLLVPETTYTFQIRGVNKDGKSPWTSFSATTKSNPLEFAIKGIQGETSVPSQGRSLTKLFDFKEGDDLWHTKYGANAIPFDLTMDLQSINTLDKMQYIPRDNAGNGTILKGSVYYSMDNENWTKVEDFTWAKDNEVKIVEFKDRPTTKYIKMHVTEGVGNFGSGKEIYVFKVPGTESYLPGDINNDGKIDENDLMSYTNYTGARLGDADFEGYVSTGDINKNGLIDAYDISFVATKLEDGIQSDTVKIVLGGKIVLTPNKKDYKTGETVEIKVSGKDLSGVNALSFGLPYNPQEMEYEGLSDLNVKDMHNLTKDKLHTNGVKALYPTFVNLGTKPLLSGSEQLMIIKFKAKKDFKYNLTPVDGVLVDRKLKNVSF